MAGIEKIVSKILLDEGVADIEFNKYTDMRHIGNLFSSRILIQDLLDITKYIPKVVSWSVLKSSLPEKLSWSETMKIYEQAIKINPQMNYSYMYASIMRTIEESCPADSRRLMNISDRFDEINKKIEQEKTKLENSAKTKNGQHPKKQTEQKRSLLDILSNVDYKSLQESLKDEVIGQDEAIKYIMKPLIDTKHKGWPKKGVSATYLIGPSGVGKTSSIEHLAKDLLEAPFLYIQGSDFKEKHEASRLKGSPPGYIGHKSDGGILTKFIKDNPEGIILFDEIDKVHPDIYAYLISFLGDGFVTTPDGESYPFDGFVYFTSNDGNNEYESAIGREVGFNSQTISDSELERKRIVTILRSKGISEAFLGRINDFVNFKMLSEDILSDILDREIEILNFCELKSYEVEISENAKEFILKQGNPKKWGARNLKNMLNKYAISEFNYDLEMNELELPDDSVISVDYVDSHFIYKNDDVELVRRHIDTFA